MTKDKSPKACIHYTEAIKLSLHKRANIELKKGSQGAIIKGLNQWLKDTPIPKDLRAKIISFMPTSQTDSMKTASSLKRALGKATTPEQKKQAISEFTDSLDAETKKLLGL